jgi:hypothetical protein
MERPINLVEFMKLSKKFIDLESFDYVNQGAELCPDSPSQTGI